MKCSINVNLVIKHIYTMENQRLWKIKGYGKSKGDLVGITPSIEHVACFPPLCIRGLPVLLSQCSTLMWIKNIYKKSHQLQ